MSDVVRDMAIGIAVNADSNPLADIRREMASMQREARGLGRGVSGLGSTFVDSHRSMVSESQAFSRQVNRQTGFIRDLAKTSGTSATQMASDWRDMSREHRKSLIQSHNEMRKYRQQVLTSENDMRKLGNQMGHYTGTTNDFMKEVRRLGQEHKKANDAMINSNVGMRKSLIQTVATMSAMSSQSEKISKAYDGMGNVMYSVNKPLLAVTDRLDRMARNGSAASIALQQLGPNASMKELQDRIKLINQGIMRQQAVVTVAAAAWLGFTAILANAAMGPDVKKNLQAQADALAEYKQAVEQRTGEIANTWGIFGQVQLEKTNPRRLFLNLQQQLKVMQNWRTNLQTIAGRAGQGFANELAKMGPSAASEIAALTEMSDAGLKTYVQTWKDIHSTARVQALTELEKLRIQTQEKIASLKNALKPLGVEWERFKSTWASALQPFVDFWGQLAAGFVKIGTKMGEFVQYLNTISPWITKIGGMFAYLAVTMTLILAPMAAGIGYLFSLKAGFAAAWMFVKPLAEGLAAMGGTVLLTTALIIGLGAAFYLLWKHSDTFRNGVINGWNAIKQTAINVWGSIKPLIMGAFDAVTAFGQQKLNELKGFWLANGAQILQAVKNFFTPIAGIMQGIWSVMKFVWPAVLMLIQSVWGNIKGVVSGALNVIMGAVKIFTGLFTLDFKLMWAGVKQVFSGAVQFVWNYINLMMFGRILSAGKLFVQGFKGFFIGMWTGIRTTFTNSVNAVRGAVGNGFTAMKMIGESIMTGFRNSINGIWTAIHGNFTGMLGRIKTAVKTAWGTMREETKLIFGMFKDDIGKAWDDIVKGAKALPGRIGAGIKGAAGQVTEGVQALGTSIFKSIKKIIDGVTDGVKWVLGKLGAETILGEWKIPKYAQGTKYHPGGPAILGDGRGSNAGPELYRTPQGKVGLSPARDTMMNLPKGTQVLSATNTRKVLSGMPAYNQGNTTVGDFMAGAGSAIKNTASGAWDGIKDAAGKVKDLGVDVFSYLGNPSGLLDKVWSGLGVIFPQMKGAFKDVGIGALKMIKGAAVNFIKGKMGDFSFLGGGSAPNVSGGAAAWRPMILQAAARMREAVTPAQVQGIIAQIQRESGGNQRIFQHPSVDDINMRNGNPARGLLQYIPSTFRSYMVKGHTDILNGMHQLLAFFNNTNWRKDLPYGRRGWGPTGARKYKNGTNFHPGGPAVVGDGWKRELIRLPGGISYLSPSVPTALNMPRGSSVLSGDKTIKAMKDTYSPSSMTSPEELYIPSTYTATGSGGQNIEFNTTVHVQVDGSAGTFDEVQLKRKIEAGVKDGLEEHYAKLMRILSLHTE